MSEEILINHTPYETQVYWVNDGTLQEVYVADADDKAMVGHVYWGRVVRVLPGMQSAFVDIGLERTAFLHANDLCWPEGLEKRPCISTQLKEQDTLAVQIIKAPIGSKGARLSTQLSFAARYLVFMPYLNNHGLSTRIEEPETRERLESWLAQFEGEGGYIVRTAAECVPHAALMNNKRYLEKRWEEVKQAMSGVLTVGTLLHEELPLGLRALRDLATEKTDRILVNEQDMFQAVSEFCDKCMPEFKAKVSLYQDNKPLFDLYHIEEEIKKALSRQVSLKSGGFLVFDQTEAMTTIDVNTGGFVGKKNVDDTLFKTNLEAAYAIAKQIRLRNLGGILIVDFIDMSEASHREQVRSEFLKALENDPVKTYVSEFSELGLIQMTRKRTRSSLEHVYCETCPTCTGRGKVRAIQTICRDILKEVMRSAKHYQAKNYLILASQEVVDQCMEASAEQVLWVEAQLEITLQFQVEPLYQQENFDVVLR